MWTSLGLNRDNRGSLYEDQSDLVGIRLGPDWDLNGTREGPSRDQSRYQVDMVRTMKVGTLWRDVGNKCGPRRDH